VPTGFWWGNMGERENLEDLEFKWKDNIEMYLY
jgi:hypothetical protein